MNNKLIGGIAVLGLLVAVIGFFIHSQPSSSPISFGATTDSTEPFKCYSGVCHWYYKQAFLKATTTPCAFVGPAASSTLVYASINVTSASSSATIWDFAKSNTRFATTTALNAGVTLDANPLGNGFITASTSMQAASTTSFKPNQAVVFGVRQGITPGDAAGTGFAPVGYCEAEFITAL